MKLTGFTANSDIVGRRVRIRWTFVPEGTETLADAPPVVLRRKLRDFAYPPPGAGDPYLVYDRKAFPPPPVPGTLTVTDLPSWETPRDGGRTVYESESVAVSSGGRMTEVLRRTSATFFDT